jgi:tetratricopeptide (TPR) repeat protein
VLEARARIASGDVTAGLKELTDAVDTVVDRVECLRSLAMLADEAHDERRATQALEKIAKAGCSDDGECAGNLAWIAIVEEGRGNQRRALALYRRARERAPQQDSLLESAARLAASLGLHAEAAEDYRELTRRHPGDPRWAKAAEDERMAAVRAAVAL